MKTLNLNDLENLQGGIIEPGPGEAERCRALTFATFVLLNGNPMGLTPNDFECQF